MPAKDFLLEIGCEELPAQGLWPFIEKLAAEFTAAINHALLGFKDYEVFATPRRLAVLVRQLTRTQPNRTLEKRGPAITAPDAAKQGFARSCNVTIEQLQAENGYWIYRYEEIGQDVHHLLPQLLTQTINKISGVKWMRWGSHTATFLRPVNWVVMLYGDELINTDLFGQATVNETQGHHFHHPAKLLLQQASDYEDVLAEEGFVRANFIKRREIIRQQIQQQAAAHNHRVLIDEALLNEVTGLVEWPVALLCQFPEAYLSIPKEALISSMQHHQKCFPVVNGKDNLQPYFITVSNITSHAPKQVIAGNERVMRARLADAAFFYHQDLKENFAGRLAQLKNITFQKKLGSVADKVERVAHIAQTIAKALHADSQKVQRAARLAKCDLTTQMVGEFPELQGIMGEYYAKAQHEDEEIALAIREHYLPRFAGDYLPKTAVSCAVALADRMDTLNSIFSIDQAPTGDKDPFALKRAANGVIRIIIEKELRGIRLSEFMPETVQQFILERLPAFYQEQQIALDSVQAVLEVQRDNLHDLHQRILAVEAFRQLPAAVALSEANKRVKNILRKNEQLDNQLTFNLNAINQSLLAHAAEKDLYQHLSKLVIGEKIAYQLLLKQLASLKEVVDTFFDQVMVEVEDEWIKHNRVELLKNLRCLFLQVADISLLKLSNLPEEQNKAHNAAKVSASAPQSETNGNASHD